MKLKISKAKKALTLSLAFVIAFAGFMVSGSEGNDAWRAYAADTANAKYSLAGAVYKVYTNQSCTTQAQDVDGNPAQFTTNASGDGTSELELNTGTYYVKETKASPGYILDRKVYRVKVNADETTWVGEGVGRVSEIPQSFDLKVVKKSDNKAWNWPVEGARFKVTYTDGEQVTRNWIIQSDRNGFANLDDDHFISGDTRYKDSNGKYVVPIGKITVQEMSAPRGYLVNNAVATINVAWGGNTSTEEKDVNVTGDINSNQEVVIADTSTAGRLNTLVKMDKSGNNGWRKLLGAEYTLKYYR